MTNFTQADVDQAVRTERHRHQIVLASAACKNREAAALHLLASSDLDSAAIIAALSGIAAGQSLDPASDGQSDQQSEFERGKAIAGKLPVGVRR